MLQNIYIDVNYYLGDDYGYFSDHVLRRRLVKISKCKLLHQLDIFTELSDEIITISLYGQ